MRPVSHVAQEWPKWRLGEASMTFDLDDELGIGRRTCESVHLQDGSRAQREDLQLRDGTLFAATQTRHYPTAHSTLFSK